MTGSSIEQHGSTLNIVFSTSIQYKSNLLSGILLLFILRVLELEPKILKVWEKRIALHPSFFLEIQVRQDNTKMKLTFVVILSYSCHLDHLDITRTKGPGYVKCALLWFPTASEA